MPKTSPYLEFVTEQLAPMGTIASRFMMGGWVLYCDGVVFALVADNALYLKADDENRTMFEQQELPQFKPFPDQNVVMKYYLAPPEVFENANSMRGWVGSAVAAGQRAVAKRKPVKKSKA